MLLNATAILLPLNEASNYYFVFCLLNPLLNLTSAECVGFRGGLKSAFVFLFSQ